ncbi:MAG: PD40 domain-containing protein [Saprospiraceae bacterium]|nr:PD40 domain-containing protein [Saprospiraceae bacterium]
MTGMKGEETLPRISPDGKWIAFSAHNLGIRCIHHANPGRRDQTIDFS